MKNFKCQINVVSRSDGASIVQRSAYRSGQKITDAETGKTYDYSHRKDVCFSYITAPKNSPGWALYPEKVWNAAAKADTRKNSRLARELMISLPAEFTYEERALLVAEIAHYLVKQYKVVVQADIHEPKIFSAEELFKLKGQHAVPMQSAPGFFHNENWHTHILFSTREMTPIGFGKKTRVLDDGKTGRVEIEKIRQAVADMINAKAREAGIDLFMHSKSARRRGSPEIPTIPLGQKGHWAAKRGLPHTTAELNQRIAKHNRTLTEADFDEFLKQPGFTKPSLGMSM